MSEQDNQTIARIRQAAHSNQTVLVSGSKVYTDELALLRIVDSQTAQIAVQELAIAQARAEIERLTELLSEDQRMHGETIKQLEDACAEKGLEIEWLKDCMRQHMDSETYNHCQDYLDKMRSKYAKAN